LGARQRRLERPGADLSDDERTLLVNLLTLEIERSKYGYEEWLLDRSLSGTEQLAHTFGFRTANVMKACGIVSGSHLMIYGRKALARERGGGPVMLARIDLAARLQE
jgi:hypothetical protein